MRDEWDWPLVTHAGSSVQLSKTRRSYLTFVPSKPAAFTAAMSFSPSADYSAIITVAVLAAKSTFASLTPSQAINASRTAGGQATGQRIPGTASTMALAPSGTLVAETAVAAIVEEGAASSEPAVTVGTAAVEELITGTAPVETVRAGPWLQPATAKAHSAGAATRNCQTRCLMSHLPKKRKRSPNRVLKQRDSLTQNFGVRCADSNRAANYCGIPLRNRFSCQSYCAQRRVRHLLYRIGI